MQKLLPASENKYSIHSWKSPGEKEEYFVILHILAGTAVISGDPILANQNTAQITTSPAPTLACHWSAV